MIVHDCEVELGVAEPIASSDSCVFRLEEDFAVCLNEEGAEGVVSLLPRRATSIAVLRWRSSSGRPSPSTTPLGPSRV
jgi:hypothetical protein